MKKGIHPKLNTIKVTCNCGYSFETHTTLSNLNTEICSNCHPFFTGNERFVDTEGRIDKFNRKRNLAQNTTKKEEVKNEKPSFESNYKPSLKEIFNQPSNN